MDTKLHIVKEYKLEGERRVSARRPLIHDGKLYAVFIYDKGSFIESIIKCFESESFELVWERKYDHVINNAEVSASGNILCSLMGGQVSCLDSVSGDVKWEWQADEDHINIGAVSNDEEGRVVVAGTGGGAKSTWCINSQDGTQIWKFNNGGHSYIPRITNGNLYQATQNTLNVIDMNTGELTWSSIEETTYLFNPVIINDFVLIGGHGLVNIYNKDSGTLMSQINIDDKEAIRSIINDGEFIYFGDNAGNLYCYKIEQYNNDLKCERIWKTPTSGGIEGSPACVESYVFAINNDSKLVMVDKTLGNQVAVLNIKGPAGISGVTECDGFIYTAAERYIHKINT